MTDHPEREFFPQKFVINEENAEAPFKNLFGNISRKKSSVYQNAVNTVKGRDILNKCFITDSETVLKM